MKKTIDAMSINELIIGVAWIDEYLGKAIDVLKAIYEQAPSADNKELKKMNAAIVELNKDMAQHHRLKADYLQEIIGRTIILVEEKQK